MSSSDSALDPRLLLPPSNDSMAGEGPVRRADWFLPIWAERRSLFAARTKEDEGALVFLGDSITSGWGLDFRGEFAGVRAANRGISGDTTRGVLYRLADDVLALRPRAVVLLIGTNDLEENADAPTIVGNLRLILDALHGHTPELPVVLCEVFPSSVEKNRSVERVKAVNAAFEREAKARRNITLVKTWAAFADEAGNAKVAEFPDLLHPNEAGYRKWAETLKPVLRQLGLI